MGVQTGMPTMLCMYVVHRPKGGLWDPGFLESVLYSPFLWPIPQSQAKAPGWGFHGTFCYRKLWPPHSHTLESMPCWLWGRHGHAGSPRGPPCEDSPCPRPARSRGLGPKTARKGNLPTTWVNFPAAPSQSSLQISSSPASTLCNPAEDPDAGPQHLCNNRNMLF